MFNPTRIAAATTVAALALLSVAPAAGATTRPYLGLPDDQLANVEQFDISDTGHLTIDFTVPTNVPAGHVWTYMQAGFGAGEFEQQQPVHELLAPGQHFTVNVATGTPCTQADLVLTGTLNDSGQPYAAALTDTDVCQPGYTPPEEHHDSPPPAPPAPEAPTGEQAAPPTTEAVSPPTTEAPAPEAPAPAAETPGPVAAQPVGVESAGASALPVTGSSNAGPMTATALALFVLGSAACIPNWLKRHALR
jgi:hypothetical protein